MNVTSTVYGPPPPPDAAPASAPLPEPNPAIALVSEESVEPDVNTQHDAMVSVPSEPDEQDETIPAETPIAVSERVIIFDEDESESEPDLDDPDSDELAFGPELDPEPDVEVAPVPAVKLAPVAPAIVAPATAPKDRSVAAAQPSNPVSMTRKNRWKRRRGSISSSRMMTAAAAGVFCLALVAIFQFSSGEAKTGPDGPFAQAVYQAFPEADPQSITTVEDGDLPLAATLHMPAYLIEPASGSDPFARLGAEFGGAERTLSGLEMAARVERVATTVLPSDLIRCHTYKIGPISSAPEAPRRTRALYLRLNPGC